MIHSATKYLNGHTDVIMGCTMTNRDDLNARIRFLQESLYVFPHQKSLANDFLCLRIDVGAVPSPFDCYMVNRGLKTLHIRMLHHMKNGLAIAKFLESHPAVERVLHPGEHLLATILKTSCLL